jgi:hypothetical protein
VACPRDNVTGIYYTTITNVRHNCLLPIPSPSPEVVTVTQNGTALTFQSELINASGTINQQTGVFAASQQVTPGGICPYGCRASLSGVFGLGKDPMRFSGSGQLQLLGPFGGVLCTVNYDAAGERTRCTIP